MFSDVVYGALLRTIAEALVATQTHYSDVYLKRLKIELRSKMLIGSRIFEMETLNKESNVEY